MRVVKVDRHHRYRRYLGPQEIKPRTNAATIIVEEYPDFHKGPCVLVLQKDRDNKPIHVVWGIPKGCAKPAVLMTAYRPDPDRWDSDFTGRKK